MLIFPAIDLYDGKAVRLYKGDYAQMTVYSENPPEIAETFYQQGAGGLPAPCRSRGGENRRNPEP